MHKRNLAFLCKTDMLSCAKTIGIFLCTGEMQVQKVAQDVKKASVEKFPKPFLALVMIFYL